MIKKWIFTQFLALSICVAWSAAHADTYPSRVIKLIVPFSAGGVGDVVARVLADKLSGELGQPVIVDNRPGGNSAVGTQYAARSEPDGYTIIQLATSGIIVAQIQKGVTYDLERDFAPVVEVGAAPLALVVMGKSDVHSIEDLVALSRSRRGGINYASGGAGSVGHLSAILFGQKLKMNATHVPFTGNGQAMQALLGDQVQFAFPVLVDVLQLAKSGDIRILGVTSERRLPGLPDVPTMRELGFADIDPVVRYGYLVPAKTPAEIVSRLQQAFAKVVAEPGVQERLTSLGLVVKTSTTAEFAKILHEELARWHQVIQDNNLRADN